MRVNYLDHLLSIRSLDLIPFKDDSDSALRSIYIYRDDSFLPFHITNSYGASPFYMQYYASRFVPRDCDISLAVLLFNVWWKYVIKLVEFFTNI